MAIPVPLGLESGVIQNRDLSASSCKPGYEAWRARLHGVSHWKPVSDDTKQYWTAVLHRMIKMSGIATQGASYGTCWVTQYRLVSYDGHSWDLYREDGIVIVSREACILSPSYPRPK